MPGWLTTDPLNGIIITISFFISIIAGRYIRDKVSGHCIKSRLMDPRIKIFVLFLLIISISYMDQWYLPAGISILCFFIALQRNIFRDYSRKLIFPVMMAFFIVAIQGMTYGTHRIYIGFIPVFQEGLESGYLIFSKVIAAASLSILLLSTTHENEIIETMRWYRVPSTMIDISSLMRRYITAFSTEAKKLKQAQDSRCGFSGGYMKKMRDIAAITGALICRADIRAEQVYRAMISRGWKHDDFQARQQDGLQ